MKRVRERKFQAIEDKLIQYVDLRARLYGQDKCGTSWTILELKCKQWAAEAGFEDFKASAGWISNVLKRNSKVGINLHREESDISEEEEAIAQLEVAEAQAAAGVESESDGSDDEDDTAMSIRTNHEAEVMIGDLISYCKRRKFNDAISYLEKASKKIRNAHIEERANSSAQKVALK